MKDRVTAVADGPRAALAVAIATHAEAQATLDEASQAVTEVESQKWKVLTAIDEAEKTVQGFRRMGDPDRAAIAAETLAILQRDELPARAAVVDAKDRIPNLERALERTKEHLSWAASAVAKAEVAPIVAGLLAGIKQAHRVLMTSGPLLEWCQLRGFIPDELTRDAQATLNLYFQPHDGRKVEPMPWKAALLALESDAKAQFPVSKAPENG